MNDMRDIKYAIDRLAEAVRTQNELIEAMGKMMAQFMNYQIQKQEKQEKQEVSE